MKKNFEERTYFDVETGLWLDFNSLDLTQDFLDSKKSVIEKSLSQMIELEKGFISNPDEERMVGHYWLRSPTFAPTKEIENQIREANIAIDDFVSKIHDGIIAGSEGKAFKNALIIGIGGSSLGTVFVSEALKTKQDKIKLYIINNTDPAGMDMIFSELEDELAETLVIVISKSGGTVETRNAMLEAQSFFSKNGLDFVKQSVRITQEGSAFDVSFDRNRRLETFPIWDWVGGRTSIFSAVGLLPLALQGVDCKALLLGAATCDKLTRRLDYSNNPAAMLAMAWLSQTNALGGTSMVMLPYKDQLEGLSKYLQQLIMESLGKEFDLDNKVVRQGLAVFGNKGSSDQHSYVQQLVAGQDKLFVTFISVLKDRAFKSPIIGEDSTSGDYLQAFMLGTERALKDNGKASLTITIPEVNSFYIGMLIALFERTVGLYANLININAYHQPAVEFGKKAATSIIVLKNTLTLHMKANAGKTYTATELATELNAIDKSDLLLKLLFHLSANGVIEKNQTPTLSETTFYYS